MKHVVRTRDTCCNKPRIDSRYLPCTGECVRQLGMVRRGKRLQMVGVDARPIFALVMDMKSGRGFTESLYKCDSVSANLFPVRHGLGVAIVRECPIPIPALGDRINRIAVFMRASLMAAYESVRNSADNAAPGVRPLWNRCLATTPTLAKSTAFRADDRARCFWGRRNRQLGSALVMPTDVIGRMPLDGPASHACRRVKRGLLAAATFAQAIRVSQGSFVRRNVSQITGATSNRCLLDRASAIDAGFGGRLSVHHFDLLIRSGCCRDRGRSSAARSFIYEGIIP